jgi:hypothetical protein
MDLHSAVRYLDLHRYLDLQHYGSQNKTLELGNGMTDYMEDYF